MSLGIKKPGRDTGRKEKDKNIDKGSQEADNPHGTVLPYLQKEIKQAGQYSEIFQ